MACCRLFRSIADTLQAVYLYEEVVQIALNYRFGTVRQIARGVPPLWIFAAFWLSFPGTQWRGMPGLCLFPTKPSASAATESSWQHCPPMQHASRRENTTSSAPLRLLHEGILRQARFNPRSTAVIDVTSRNDPRRHTFTDLRALALAIRGALSPLLLRGVLGVATSRNVGVLAQGGAFALYAAWLAVLWEGCAVVPLSAEAPAEQMSSIVEDALVTVVLVTDEGSAEAAKAIFLDSNASCRDVRVVDVRTLATAATATASDGDEENGSAGVPEPAGEGAIDNSYDASGGRDCYVYFTSGSSGEPKGVSSGHNPMMNRLRWMWQRWPFVEGEVCCQRVDHVFVDFVAELFGPLSRGVPIVVVPYVVRKNPVLLRDFIAVHGVTRIILVPTLARLIVEAAATAGIALHASDRSPLTAQAISSPRTRATTAMAFFKSVRLWILSGEALPWSVANGLARLSQPTSTLLNLYGSTEVAADITFSSWKCDAMQGDDDGSDRRGNTPSVPIGRPITGCGAELMEESGGLEQGGEGGTCDYRLPAILRAINPRDHGRRGMLYVCGAGLARGYWRRQSATDKCFPSYAWDSASSCYRICSSNAPVTATAEDPQAPGDQGALNDVVGGSSSGGNGYRDGRPVRFYRTGDLGSFENIHHDGGDDCPDGKGALVYRGREDQQVKISGKKLDLGEVEACLFRTDGVKLGAAVALSGQDFVDGEGSGSEDLIFAVVSPETADAAIVREHLASSFAVPLVVVAVPIVPTLPSSGKVDRGEVRRMALRRLHHRQRGNVDPAASAREAGTRQGDNVRRNLSAEEVGSIIKKAVTCTLQPGRDTPAGQQAEVSDTSDFFAEVGLSSVQAVNLVHELRRTLPAASGGENRRATAVRLIDLYLHPSCRSLAQWLVPTADGTTMDFEQLHRDFVGEAELPAVGVAVSSEQSNAAPGAPDDRSSGGVRFKVGPVTRDLRHETVVLFCSVFLDSEPLLSTSFRRSRARVGPVGAAVVRLCYSRLVSRSIDSLLRSGGRVLVATEHATGRVLGFTIGTELVESAEGSGFFAGGCVEGRGAGLEDTSGPARRGGAFFRRTRRTSWEKGTSWLLGLPIRPMMRPVSALIDELLRMYQYDRGWAYSPGEVMYISETGCRLDQPKICNMRAVKAAGGGGGGGGGAKATGTGGGGGVQAALMAEALERQLVGEATAAGFVRAVTICTNAVTVHVARELGFKEVARIPVQTYRPRRDDQKGTGRWTGSGPRKPRQDGTPSAVERPGSDPPRGPAPFARVSAEHADAVLFEKVLAPGVPLGLLLHRSHHETAATTTTTSSAAAALSGSGVVASAAAELWQLVPVGKGCPGRHQREMLAILANSLPALSFSGRATRYMAKDAEKGQEAFLLLSARAAAIEPGTPGETAVVPPPPAKTEEGSTGQPDKPGRARADLLLPSPSEWTVAACMSWRRHMSDSDASPEAARPAGMEAGHDSRGVNEGRRTRGEESAAVLPFAGRELLVLAVGRRWRYRGLGAALVARLLRDSAKDGESLVYVRSLPESVGFYERQGFRAAEGVGDTGGGEHGAAAAPVPSRDGDCLLVHDLARGTQGNM